jgi:hypothetical protein
MNINIRFPLFALFVLLLGCSSVLPQRPSDRPAEKRVPNYQINLWIVDGSKYFVTIISPNQNGQIEASALHSLITDLPAGADRFNQPNNVFPKVVVEAEPTVSMLDFWNPITLFRLDHTEISVSIPTGLPSGGNVLLTVPWTSPRPRATIKPNPLFLVVTVTEDGDVSLNNQQTGTLADSEPLTKRLQQIFREREVNGVFREGTNEIERSVTIVMPMGDRRFSDLETIARAVWLPGGGPIDLVLDNPLVMDDPDPLVLPPVSPRRRP